jgi:hypothetical protein
LFKNLIKSQKSFLLNQLPTQEIGNFRKLL